MGATSQRQIVDACLASRGVRDKVVELKEPGLAAPAVGTDEGTLTSIAFPDKSTDVRRYSYITMFFEASERRVVNDRVTDLRASESRRAMQRGAIVTRLAALGRAVGECA